MRWLTPTDISGLIPHVTMGSMVAPSNAEPGCQSHILHADPADPSALFLYEQYDDEAAFQAHCDSPHFTSTVAARIFPLLTERRLEIYETA